MRVSLTRESLLNSAVVGPLLVESLPLFSDMGDCPPESIRLTDVRLGRPTIAQYRVDAAPHSARPVLITLSLFPEHAYASAASKLKRFCRSVTGRQSETRQLTAVRPDLGLLLSAYPVDVRLPQLLEATDIETATRRLAEAVSDVVDQAASGSVEVLRYVAGRRCQLRYRFTSVAGDRVVLGKVFRDGRGRVLATMMNRVAQHFAGGPDPQLVAPRAPAYLPDWNMVLQEGLEGRTLYEVLLAEEASDRQIRLAARSIARLHDGRFDCGHCHGVDQEIALIRRSFARLGGDFLDPSAGPLLQEIAGGARRDGAPAPVVPVHRDFYDKQVLLVGDRAALIDLDTLTNGNPEIDIANFMVHLRLRGLQHARLKSGVEHLQEAFVEEYLRRSTRRLDPQLLSFFRATATFRLACRYAPFDRRLGLKLLAETEHGWAARTGRPAC